jgi:hypothetical protein
MKGKLLTAALGALLLLGSGLANAHGDVKRDYRGPSHYRGHDRSWHGEHRTQRKHYHAHSHHHHHRGWHGAPGWRKHYHSGHHDKHGHHRDGVTVIFRGSF